VDATNLFWVTLAETGIIGLATFALLHAAIVGLVLRVRARVKPGHPWFSIVALSTALVFGRMTHGMVDHYWTRGSLMVAWASVGMLAWVWSATRRRK
jgi:Na+/serine symporter